MMKTIRLMDIHIIGWYDGYEDNIKITKTMIHNLQKKQQLLKSSSWNITDDIFRIFNTLSYEFHLYAATILRSAMIVSFDSSTNLSHENAIPNNHNNNNNNNETYCCKNNNNNSDSNSNSNNKKNIDPIAICYISINIQTEK